jgi:hypothetical protein
VLLRLLPVSSRDNDGDAAEAQAAWIAGQAAVKR